MAFKPKSWILVLSGVVMTIISALLVHYIVSDNMKEISALNGEKERLQSSIESFWNNADRAERNLNSAVVILTSGNPNQEIAEKLVMSSGVEYKPLSDGVTAEYIIEVGKDYRSGIISKIDGLYLEQTEIASEIIEIEEMNAFYTNLALFLQIFGLILVLSRDLGIRDN